MYLTYVYVQYNTFIKYVPTHVRITFTYICTVGMYSTYIS